MTIIVDERHILNKYTSNVGVSYCETYFTHFVNKL